MCMCTYTYRYIYRYTYIYMNKLELLVIQTHIQIHECSDKYIYLHLLEILM